MSEGIEQQIRLAHERGAHEEAVTIALTHYRDEVYSFLCARLGSESDAHDVLGQLQEDLWGGFPGFRWQCSFRTWFYTLARHAALRFERTVANQPARRRGPSAIPDDIVRERSRTRPYLRTDMKDRFANLRASLTADEQTLLVLRIDRDMSWDQVARVMHEGDLDVDAAELQRRSANLRQRFRQLKARLRERPWRKVCSTTKVRARARITCDDRAPTCVSDRADPQAYCLYFGDQGAAEDGAR